MMTGAIALYEEALYEEALYEEARATSRLEERPSTVIARPSGPEAKSTRPPASGSHSWTL